MPELPDITIYVEALRARLRGQRLENVVVRSPFVLRTVDPPISECVGKEIEAIDRIGKRIVLGLEDELYCVIHLMIAGRLYWKDPGSKLHSKLGLAAFIFSRGELHFTEASKKKRASLHVVRGHEALGAFDRGGLDVMSASLEQFTQRLRTESHTLKRSLTDPRLFDGIGNAYSDEILHRAKLSPLKRTMDLSDEEVATLYNATRETLNEWIERLRAETGDEFPTNVTAFRPEMAVHGKYRKPCPACGTLVQHIVHAENECNYCPRCQTGGKLLADRSLSRLLKADWPKSIDDLEELQQSRALDATKPSSKR